MFFYLRILFVILILAASFSSLTFVPEESICIGDLLSPLQSRNETIKAKKFGIASYYGKGDGFHGRRTASGQIFNSMELTAAHKTLTFGTKVIVSNPENGKSVTVTINDRGPYHGKREIDLSYAAALELGMVESGLQKVLINILG